MQHRTVILTSALLLCTAQLARAEPVTYLTGGYYSIQSGSDAYRFEVSGGAGPAAVIEGMTDVAVPGISALSCYVCDPGEMYDIYRHTTGSGFLGEADLGTATYTSDGVYNGTFHVSGWLTFLADPIVLPAADGSSISYAIPFRARVSLDGTNIDDSGGGFFARWIGTGTARVTFVPTGDGRWTQLNGELLRFDFSDPVPEPATMLLMGTGLAGLAAARRRRRTSESPLTRAER